MEEKITVVIPCKNEGSGILRVLDLLRDQKIPLKIIVSDSSDDDYSINSLKKYVELNKDISLIKGGYPSVARNNGAKLSKSEFILFLDADIYIFDPLLIKNCLEPAIKEDLDLVTCKYKTIEKRYDWIFRIFDVFQWISSKTKPFCMGGFMLLRREAFLKLGMFNEEDKIAEDYRVSSKIKPRKFKIENFFIYTTGRRFDKKGFWYMTILFFRSWINRNNPEFFKKDYKYWV